MPTRVATQPLAFAGFTLSKPAALAAPSQTDLDAVAAARHDAHVKLRSLETQTASVVHAKPSQARALLMVPFDVAFGLSGVAGGLALVVGALCTGIEAMIVGPLPALSTDAFKILLAGAAAVGVSAAFFRGKDLVERTERTRALRANDAHVDAVEQAAEKLEGLPRYWLARRAAAVRDIAPEDEIGKRLAVVATALDAATPEVRAELEIMADIHARVFPPPAREPTSADAVHEPVRHELQVSRELEHIIRRIEQLAPEARSLMRTEIADVVVAKLDAQPGNRWRVKRFFEAFDGAPTPYVATTVPPRAKSDLLHLRQFAANVLYSNAQRRDRRADA